MKTILVIALFLMVPTANAQNWIGLLKNTPAERFDEEDLARMCEKLEGTLARDGGRLLVCGSRRTPKSWAEALRARFDASTHALWFDDSDGDNLYDGALACANRVVVTPDRIDDGAAAQLSESIARKIESELQYPGQIKVTVIREMRATEFAK